MLSGLKNEICNYKKSDSNLVSSYRVDAKLNEDVYEIYDGKVRFVFTDECVDCMDEVKRVYPDGKTELLTQSKNFPDRKPIYSSIKNSKSYLYDLGKSLVKTKMYLVKGDKVKLLDYRSIDGADWFFAAYKTSGGKVINKWIDCRDMDYCDK